jgi:hypothetical protein
MKDDKFKSYIYDLGMLLKEKAKEAKSQKEAASSADDADYETGYLMAFHEIIDVMKEQARAFNIVQKDVGIADIAPDADLL